MDFIDGEKSLNKRLQLGEQLNTSHLHLNVRSVSFINQFALPRQRKEEERKKALPKSRFNICAEEFAEKTFITENWKISVTEDISGNSNPSIRTFRTTFSKPTKENPVNSVIASAFIFVSVKGTTYNVDGYRMEGSRQIFNKVAEFNEKWIDKIVEEKKKVRKIFDMNDGGDFLKTRLPKVNPEVEEEEKAVWR